MQKDTLTCHDCNEKQEIYAVFNELQLEIPQKNVISIDVNVQFVHMQQTKHSLFQKISIACGGGNASLEE